jgi:NAD(P)-dependent dehydrogenase (short-subunit alcohol dehydrogenase family)
VDLQLEGKVAVITGGSRGIGKAVAKNLAGEGADVALVARTLGPLEEAAAEISAASGRKVLPFVADTRSDESIAAMVKAVHGAFGRIDILVNNAAQPGGHKPPPRYDEVTDALLWEDMNTKVLGYLRCAREVAPYMKEQGWGRIINVSGLAARQAGTVIGSIRNVSVSALTKNLADELGPYGINVVVVHPGNTRTEKTPGVLEAMAQDRGISVEEATRQLGEGNSIRRFVTAEDVAYVITMIASPRSIAVNGDAIAAGGGAPRAIYY